MTNKVTATTTDAAELEATIVIPTFNRIEALLQTIESIERLDYPASKWEAIIVDDGSTDSNSKLARDRAAASDKNIKFVNQSNKGPAAARNLGAANSRGAILIFIDNDILVEPGFLKKHLETIGENPGCWILGRVVHPADLRETPFGRYRDWLWESFHRSSPKGGIQETQGITTQNLSLPVADFKRFGGFDERFTLASCEDWELGNRARNAGVKVLYNPAIVVKHNDWAVSLKSFCRRQMMYSISDVLLYRQYGELSPRAEMIRLNSPIDWRLDPASLIAKKSIKSVFAVTPFNVVLRCAAKVAETLAPDSAISWKLYQMAIGAAIMAGVREGLRRYSVSATQPNGAIQTEPAGRNRNEHQSLSSDRFEQSDELF